MAKRVTTGQIKRLLEIDSEGLGIGEEVQELILRITSGGVAGIFGDPRVIQAKRYWDLGAGQKLDKKSFKEYLAEIPEIPAGLLSDDPAYPYLVLVEPRIGLTKLCRLGNVAYEGDDNTFVPYDDRHADPTQPSWTRIQDGRRNRNRPSNECRQSFAKDELGNTGLIGVCAYLQHPGVVTDLYQGDKGHAMDLPGSVRRGKRDQSLCLYVQDGRAELIWYFNDSASPRYGSASRRECK